jgi:hypothetical protein
VEAVERDTDGISEIENWAVAEMKERFRDERASQPLMIMLPTWWQIVATLLSGQNDWVKQLVATISTWLHAKANDTHAALRAAPGDELRAARAAWAAAQKATTQEQTYQCNLLLDIFGNPFRPITLDLAWLTWHDGLLVSMAQQMYDSRDFSDMPILADGLEEAGCSNQDILAHCRSGGEHVRGCWVVDLLLGKP